MAQPRRARRSERDPVADRVWVEELAMLLESYARFPRTAGRVFALMLISQEDLTTQAQLADALSVSQASVSSAVRFLLDAGWLERTRSPGVRRDQYRVRNQSWSGLIQAAVLAADSMIRQLERGLELPGPDLSPGRAQLLQLTTAHRQLRELMLEAAARADLAEPKR